MITWADAHARAAVRASQVHARLDLDLSKPVDVFAAIQQLDIVLAFSELGSTSGLYLPANSQQKLPGILLNSNHPRSRQRYTAGHELGHYAFGHSVEVDGDLEEGLEQALERGALERWPDHEKEAEAFGAWFLMPRRVLRSGLARLGLSTPRHPLDVYALSLWCGTSYSATARQLGTTRLVDPVTANRWATLPPKQLKATLSEGLAIPSYRNDIWWLDQTSNGQPVDLRPGDRLIVNLPEDASTGYTWTFDGLADPLRVVADSYVDDWEPRFRAPWTAPSNQASDADTALAGGPSLRSFVFDVAPGAQPGIYHLAGHYGREWEGQPVETFELLIAVTAPLHGVQLHEERFALAG